MPFRIEGAQRASARGLGFYSRIAVAVAIAVAAPFAPFALQTAQAGGHCGTNWDSRTDPPDKIRVYRESRDRVDVVDFKTYVEVVMTVEWPYWLPPAVLEVGAVLAKQFAWYHTLAGHHRSSYVTRDGVCYDVVDTHMDQIYKPEGADIRDRQVQAVDATWGLSLRQNGSFFLTQYRTGYDVRCGTDANGAILYAKSSINCAQDGRDRDRILHIYYEDNHTDVSLVWSDKTPAGHGDGKAPTVTAPTVTLHAGDTLTGKVAHATWTGHDASGIKKYELEKRWNGGAWHAVQLTDAKKPQADVSMAAGRRYDFRVRALDGSGLWSTWATTSAGRPQLIEGGQATLSGGDWKLDRDRRASGGASRYARTAGAKATLTFTGRGIAFISTRGPGRGTVDILIGGQKVATVDLTAPTVRYERVVFAKGWAKSDTRTIQIVTHGSGRVDLDAFVVLH